MGKSQKRRQPAKPDPAKPSAEELEVRRKQGKIDAQRAAAKKEGKTLKVTQEERALRAQQGKFMRIRANTSGTPEYQNRQRQREAAKTDEAIWESAHAPETYDSED
ncbi:hypothetical protein [Streptosporangium sp. NPDC001681]|uniref:hypothetical protein n=1 Tax=Streptosporangium sp. NPDC001681 TaxID=3154395 RepID=UPI00332D2FC1